MNAVIEAVFAALGHPLRRRILVLLRHGPLCVCHLQECLGQSQVAVSKQLALLRKSSLVQARREGGWVIYALPQPPPPLLQANLDLLALDPTFLADSRRRDLALARHAGCAPALPPSGNLPSPAHETQGPYPLHR